MLLGIFFLWIFYFIEGIIVIYGWEGGHCNPLKDWGDITNWVINWKRQV